MQFGNPCIIRVRTSLSVPLLPRSSCSLFWALLWLRLPAAWRRRPLYPISCTRIASPPSPPSPPRKKNNVLILSEAYEDSFMMKTLLKELPCDFWGIQIWDYGKTFLVRFGLCGEKWPNFGLQHQYKHIASKSYLKHLFGCSTLNSNDFLYDMRVFKTWFFHGDGVITRVWKYHKWIQREKIPLEWS